MVVLQYLATAALVQAVYLCPDEGFINITLKEGSTQNVSLSPVFSGEVSYLQWIFVSAESIRSTFIVVSSTRNMSPDYVFRLPSFIYVNTSFVRFEKARFEDRGKYIVIASIRDSTCTQVLNLDVTVRPTKVNSTTVQYNYNAVSSTSGFTWSIGVWIRMSPPQELTWLSTLGQNITEGSSVASPRFSMSLSHMENEYYISKLLVTNSSSADQGNYTVTSADVFDIVCPVVLQYPPQWVAMMGATDHQLFAVGTLLRVNCSADSSPPPSFEWYWEDVLVLNGSSTSFSKPIASIWDQGKYSCRAFNQIGAANPLSVNIATGEPPLIYADLENVFFVIGSDTELLCAVWSRPESHVTWSNNTWDLGALVNINDTVMTNSTTGLIMVQSRVYISQLYNVLGKNVSCKAENSLGVRNKTFSFFIKFGPTIMSPSQNFTFSEGSPALLLCKATGFPVPVISWYLNDVALIGHAEESYESNDTVLSSLRWSQINRNDSGFYSCVAQNANNVSQKTWRVTVEYGPQILLNPSSRMILEGSTTNTACTADSLPAPSIAWYRNNTLLTSTVSTNVSTFKVTSSATLTLISVKHTDQGTYTCVARNGISNQSTSFVLFVIFGPELVEIPPSSLHVMEMLSLSLTFFVLSFPEPLSNWTRNSVPFTGLTRNDLQHLNGSFSLKSTLLKTALTRLDSGKYCCLFATLYANVSYCVDVSIDVSPEVITFDSSQTKDSDHNTFLRLACSVEAFPAPSVSIWTANRSVINDRRVVSTSNNSFFTENNTYRVELVVILTDLSDIDDGNYSCVSQNTVGLATRVVPVDIQVAAKITSLDFNNGAIIQEGEYVTLLCMAVCSCSLSVTWGITWGTRSVSFLEKNTSRRVFGKSVLDGRRVIFSLTLLNLTEDNIDIYTCNITGDTNNDSRSLALSYPYEPLISLIAEKLTVKENETYLNLTCIVQGFPSPMVYWMFGIIMINNFTLQYQEVQSKVYINQLQSSVYSTLTSTEPLTRSMSGVYTCVARNTGGSRALNASLSVTYLDSVSMSPSGYTEYSVRYSFNVTCQTQGFHTPDLQLLFTEADHQNVTLLFSISNSTFRLTVWSISLKSSFREAQYECRASNYLFNQSDFLTVRGRYSPVLLNKSNDIVMAIEGNTITLFCLFDAYPPVDVFFWLRDSRFFRIDTASTITIDNVEYPVDEGKYVCSAFNFEGYTESKPIKVSILAAPFIYELNCDDHLPWSANISCVCSVSSNPPSEVRWTHDGLNATGEKLNFRLASIADMVDQLITCSASNNLGTTSKSLLVLADNLWNKTLGDWTEWSSCSVTCGKGIRSRKRSCLSPDLCPMTFRFGTVECTNDFCERYFGLLVVLAFLAFIFVLFIIFIFRKFWRPSQWIFQKPYVPFKSPDMDVDADATRANEPKAEKSWRFSRRLAKIDSVPPTVPGPMDLPMVAEVVTYRI